MSLSYSDPRFIDWGIELIHVWLTQLFVSRSFLLIFLVTQIFSYLKLDLFQTFYIWLSWSSISSVFRHVQSGQGPPSLSNTGKKKSKIFKWKSIEIQFEWWFFSRFTGQESNTIDRHPGAMDKLSYVQLVDIRVWPFAWLASRTKDGWPMSHLGMPAAVEFQHLLIC